MRFSSEFTYTAPLTLFRWQLQVDHNLKPPCKWGYWFHAIFFLLSIYWHAVVGMGVIKTLDIWIGHLFPDFIFESGKSPSLTNWERNSKACNLAQLRSQKAFCKIIDLMMVHWNQITKSDLKYSTMPKLFAIYTINCTMATSCCNFGYEFKCPSLTV